MTTRTRRVHPPPVAHWLNRDDRRPRAGVRTWTGTVAGYDRNDTVVEDLFRRWTRTLPRPSSGG